MTKEQQQDENKVIDEAIALDRQGRNNRPKRLQFELGNYNQYEFDKLFTVDKYHEK